MTKRQANPRFKKLSHKSASGFLHFGLYTDPRSLHPQISARFTASTAPCTLLHDQIPHRADHSFLAHRPPATLQSP